MRKNSKGSEKYYCKETCLALFNTGFMQLFDCILLLYERHLLTFHSIIVLLESLRGTGLYNKRFSSLRG